MLRRKQFTFHIQDLKYAGHIIEELSKLPQLANFDMNSVELAIKGIFSKCPLKSKMTYEDGRT